MLHAAGLAHDMLEVLQHQGWDAYKQLRSARRGAAHKLLLGLRKAAKRREEEGEGDGAGGGGAAEQHLQQDEEEQQEGDAQVVDSLSQAEVGGSATPTPPDPPAESGWKRMVGSSRLRALLHTASRAVGGGGGAAGLVQQGGVRGPEEDIS